jgi:hypothetical protein
MHASVHVVFDLQDLDEILDAVIFDIVAVGREFVSIVAHDNYLSPAWSG